MEYNKLSSEEIIEKTVKALESKGFETFVVESGNEALEKIKEMIPQGASVMNGSSVTLEEVGFVDYLKSNKHGWNNLHQNIVEEKDPIKKSLLRKESLLSDYYLGSVHALTESGEWVVASNTGSQLPHIVFSSPNLIFVVGTQKIVPNLAEAMNRLEAYVYPLEDKHMQEKYGSGSMISKILIFKEESPLTKRKIKMILVKENLGF